MPIILSTGSNLGQKEENLSKAKDFLSKIFSLVDASKIVRSKAVDYLEQDDFLNQILVFKSSHYDPFEVLSICQDIEKKMKRVKLIQKGPRIIDVDLLFYDNYQLHHPRLTIPHHAWNKRQFIIEAFSTIKNEYKNSYL